MVRDGIKLDKIPLEVYEDKICRHGKETAPPSNIVSTTFYLLKGDKAITAEAIFMKKLQHLVFQIGDKSVIANR